MEKNKKLLLLAFLVLTVPLAFARPRLIPWIVAASIAYGGAIELAADTDCKVLILSGAPIDEPVVMHGPFVMNTDQEIRQAMRDFQTGRFGAIPA